MNSSPQQVDMEIMHKMCHKELNKLTLNLECFLKSSENIKKLLNGRWKSGGGMNSGAGFGGSDGGAKNMFAFIAFDRYMAQLTTVLNMARKFNIHFQLNELSETVLNDLEAVGVGSCSSPRLFQDFIQWSMLGRGECDKHSNKNNELFEMSDYNVNDLDGKITERKAIESSPERPTTSDESSRKETPVRKTSRKNNCNDSNIEDYLQTFLPTKSISHLKNGHKLSASITHVKDTNKLLFYVCEMSDYHTLFEISCSTDLEPIPSSTAMLEKKVFCVAQHKRETAKDRKCVWRAVVVPENFSHEPNLALLIDFGEIIHLTEECELYAPSQKYATIPSLAIKCILKGVYDSEGLLVTDHSKCKAILIAKEFKMTTFIVLSQESGVLQVMLLDTKEEEIRPLPSSIPSPPRVDNRRNPFLDSILLEDESDGNSDPMPLPISAVYGNPIKVQPPKPDKICDNLQVTVTHVTSPVNFYGVIEGAANKEIDDVFFWNDMQISPIQREKSEPLQLNDVILARYIKDNHWYRAKIIAIMTDDNLYKVFYIDFGNTEVVPLSSIATCNAQQKKSPAQAVLFRIAGIKLVYTGGTNEVANKRLRQATEAVVVLILNQTVSVIVDRSNRSGSDEMVVSFTDEQYSNITSMLLDMGVVKEV